MNNGTLTIILVSDKDNEKLIALLTKSLALLSKIQQVHQKEHIITIVTKGYADIILLDSSLPDRNGETHLTMLQRRFPTLPIVMVVDDDTSGLQAIREGAQDYLLRNQQLCGVIRHTILSAKERQAYSNQQQRRYTTGVLEVQEQQDNTETLIKQLYDVLNTASTELARARRIKDDFVLMMSHELRTPLNAILGLSEALQEEVYGSITEKQRSSLHNIEQNGRYLLYLINNILDLAKIEAGKANLLIDTVVVADICEASMRTVHEEATAKQIEISLVPDSKVDTLQADARRLKQMLVHLLTNAIKFTPAGGKVGLIITGDTENNRVLFTIWDTGIGIDSADTAYLFQSFMQLGTSLSRHQRGIGVGLVLVARLAEQHGGSINFISEVNKGSQFILSLPWQCSK